MSNGVTPHERRVRENKARRQVIADLEALIRSSTGTVPAAGVLAVFEQAASSLPADSKLLARVFGFPYFPITPFFPLLGPLGMVPLPSKWIIEFGEPITLDHHDLEAWQDAMLVFNLTDRIRDNIQQMLYRNLMSRRSVFF